MTPNKLSHFIAGAVIYTSAQFFGTPFEAMLAAVSIAVGKECWDAAQNKRATGRYSVKVLDALATVAGGLLIYISGVIA